MTRPAGRLVSGKLCGFVCFDFLLLIGWMPDRWYVSQDFIQRNYSEAGMIGSRDEKSNASKSNISIIPWTISTWQCIFKLLSITTFHTHRAFWRMQIRICIVFRMSAGYRGRLQIMITWWCWWFWRFVREKWCIVTTDWLSSLALLVPCDFQLARLE